MSDGTLELWLMLSAGVFVAAVGVLFALVLFAASPASRVPLFSAVGRIQAPANGLAIVASFIIVMTSPIVMQSLLHKLHFFQAVYGPDFPAEGTESSAITVRFLWAAAFAFPIQLGLILGMVHAQRGLAALSLRGWTRNAVAGYLAWLISTPIVFSVFLLASFVHSWLTGLPPGKHPLTKLGDTSGKLEWTMLVLQVVLQAPVLEELTFRGLLLPWMAQKRVADSDSPLAVPPSRRPLAVMLLAVAFAMYSHLDQFRQAFKAGDRQETTAHSSAIVFFVCLLPLMVVGSPIARIRRFLRIRSVHQYQAIVASSALFAAFHAQVWPSPVPLFVLSLGLGYLYLRTRSLVGPIVVHGLFNAVSAVYLLIGGTA